MKIRNLYIGDVCKIENIMMECTGSSFYGSIQYSLQRKTLLYRRKDTDKYYKDILYGGKFQFKETQNDRIGEMFVSNVESVINDSEIEPYANLRVNGFKLKRDLKRKLKNKDNDTSKQYGVVAKLLKRIN